MFLDFLFPILFFFLVFLLIFGILEKLKIFSKVINGTIAICIAFYSFLLLNHFGKLSEFLGFLSLSILFFVLTTLIIVVILNLKRIYKESS